MSTSTFVPETYGLDSDDARTTLRRVGIGHLLSRSFQRFRAADGTSHARSIGWIIALVTLQGIIAVVGFATALGEGDVAELVARTMQSIVPGPAGETLQTSLDQATSSGSDHRYTALLLGLVGAIVTGCTGFGQVERAANRIYGIEKDRPVVAKYARALGLTLTAGVAGTAAFVMLAIGWDVGGSIESDTASTVWSIVRWPLGVLMVTAATTAIFMWSPRRRQPDASWMVLGGSLSVLAWLVVSVAMSLFLRWSGSFGETYGPLAGLVALLLWSFLSAVALLAGLTVAAELEAQRAGVEAGAPTSGGDGGSTPSRPLARA
jgi:YihY family inner membrane protein